MEDIKTPRTNTSKTHWTLIVQRTPNPSPSVSDTQTHVISLTDDGDKDGSDDSNGSESQKSNSKQSGVRIGRLSSH